MERYHPGVITLYFAAMLVFTAWFQQPVFLALSLFTALVVSKATLGDQWNRRLGWSLLLGAVVGVWWAVFARFGDTILLDNLLGNPLTLEGLVYSATLWVRVTAVVLWWESLLRLVPAERLLTLTGKVFPHLSLYGTVLLRFLPQLRRQRQGIQAARAGIGVAESWREKTRRESMVATWGLESLQRTVQAMRCRGYSLRRRTTYQATWLKHGDRLLLLLEGWGIVLLLCGWALNQTRAWYDPELIVNRVTPLSGMFYAVYVLFALLPVELALQMRLRERRDQRNREKGGMG